MWIEFLNINIFLDKFHIIHNRLYLVNFDGLHVRTPPGCISENRKTNLLQSLWIIFE